MTAAANLALYHRDARGDDVTTEELLELDAEVHRRVFGLESRPLRNSEALGGEVRSDLPWRDLATREPVPRYSADMAAAWEVHMAMCDRPYSVRRRYLRAIQGQTTCRMGTTVLWPDVLVVLRHRMPEAICRAALAAAAQAANAGPPGEDD